MKDSASHGNKIALIIFPFVRAITEIMYKKTSFRLTLRGPIGEVVKSASTTASLVSYEISGLPTSILTIKNHPRSNR